MNLSRLCSLKTPMNCDEMEKNKIHLKMEGKQHYLNFLWLSESYTLKVTLNVTPTVFQVVSHLRKYCLSQYTSKINCRMYDLKKSQILPLKCEKA